MYSKDRLLQYPFFAAKMSEVSLESLIDPLTGVLSRASILDFAKSLIEAGTPFTFGIMDLDNFKFINDTYGHHAGDAVLSYVAGDLAVYLADVGVVGRFGGDEFVFVDLRHRTYDEKKECLGGMYDNGAVLRKNIPLEDCNPFITATIGCATYPDDADHYNGLFELIDKTLYRGKTKGRNCHIIYVEEKHRDIQIRQIARHGVCTALQSLVRQFEMVPGLMNKLRSVTPLLMEELRISDLYFTDTDCILHSVRNPAFSEPVGDLRMMMNDDLFHTNSLDIIEKKCPVFHAVLMKHEMETVMMARIGIDMETYGYLICAEPRSRRIWQEDERAILFFLAKLIASRIRIDGEQLGV